MQEKEGGDGVKQILVILGGGRRNGNTKQLADSFVSGAAQAGHRPNSKRLSRDFIALPREMKHRLTAGTRSIL